MADVQQDFVYNKNLLALQRCMGVIFNNAKFSDTVFTVKQNKFYALSHLVAISSSTLDTLISNHYAACNDRDININDVKYEESFSVILRYVYGLELNFTQMNTVVMCEVLNLSETYCLREFSEDLKTFICKIDTFNMDSLAVLLNTAKKFNMTELYEKLSIYAYEHADELVKHESVVDLQYDVLLDLLKSDWFCTSEIDILKGVLEWHADMDKQGSKNVHLDVKNESEDVIKEQDIKSDIQSDASDCETDVAESIDTLSLEEDSKKENLHDENSDLEERAESSVNKFLSKEETIVSNETDSKQDVETSFSENVLKSLLRHIRAPRLSVFEFNKALKTDLFLKYKDFLENEDCFSHTMDSRTRRCQVSTKVEAGYCTPSTSEGADQSLAQVDKSEESTSNPGGAKENYSGDAVRKCVVLKPKLADVKAEYKITHPVDLRGIEVCEQEYQIGDFKWKLSAEYLVYSLFYKEKYVRMCLECTSDKLKDWECNAKCQLKWNNIYGNSEFLPNSKDFSTFKFSSHHPRVHFGQFDVPNSQSDSYKFKAPNDVYTFTVNFKSIDIREGTNNAA